MVKFSRKNKGDAKKKAKKIISRWSVKLKNLWFKNSPHSMQLSGHFSFNDSPSSSNWNSLTSSSTNNYAIEIV
jgi:hypothetical protein